MPGWVLRISPLLEVKIADDFSQSRSVHRLPALHNTLLCFGVVEHHCLLCLHILLDAKSSFEIMLCTLVTKKNSGKLCTRSLPSVLFPVDVECSEPIVAQAAFESIKCMNLVHFESRVNKAVSQLSTHMRPATLPPILTSTHCLLISPPTVLPLRI